ncbi:MAG: NADH-quinone oxidoreductase subunit N [Gemmatimonadaceae bacterium]
MMPSGPLDLALPLPLLIALGPDLVLASGTMVILLFAGWCRESTTHQRNVGVASIVVLLATASTVILYAAHGFTARPGPLAVDNFRWMADLIFLLGALFTVIVSRDYNQKEDITAPEAHVMVLFATSGMLLLGAARDLIIVFLGIELMSLASYVLAGLNRRSSRSAEAALKYFLLGAFSTGFLLYGIALVYGATGATQLDVIGSRIRDAGTPGPTLIIGVALLLVGFAFKVAAAPFHMWAPDVYDGAPTPIGGFMAATVKAAGLAAFIRVWLEAFPQIIALWHPAVWWLAAITMLTGNLIGLAQRNVKRLLAYSSIGHTGFLLVALTSGTAEASSVFLYYLLAYTLATIGAFAIAACLGEAADPHLDLDDYAGLWDVRPWMALAMSVFMLALLGFPIFGGAGFIAKWYLMRTALGGMAPQVILVVILAIATTIAAGFYLNVVTVMFMRTRGKNAVPIGPTPRGSAVVIIASVVLLAAFGAFPATVVNWAAANGILRAPGSTGEAITANTPR